MNDSGCNNVCEAWMLHYLISRWSKLISYKLLILLFLVLAAVSASAQDIFNPTLPGEPNATYKVTVGISHPEAGQVYGAGSYYSGEEVFINKRDAWRSDDADVYYQFRCWMLNGEEYTTDGAFYYVIGQENAHFVAVYDVVDPDDVTSRVYIQISPADACSSYTTSGQRYTENSFAYLYCYKRSGFDFLGWYDGETLVSQEQNFDYLVGKDDVTLTARFEFNPFIPNEPINGGQTDVDNPQIIDVDGNGLVNEQDIEACVKALLEESDNGRADVNRDGRISVQDVILLIDRIVIKKLE